MVQERPIRVERRLSAILAADVAGYSRLMHSSEELTHAKLTALLTEAVNPAIAEHGGRIVKNTGDGFLAEFPSAVEAVRAAMEFQTCIRDLTIGEEEDRRIAFRVGVNIGDIIVEAHDIFGDGVNIAVRLEGIAEPGGICISSSAYDQVRGKVGVEFADLGEQNLKNIARPVRAYAMIRGEHSLSTRAESGTLGSRPPPRLSIVVLPFTNLSGDPEQDYFVDGVTENLTTDLSRISGSFVIARNSAFSYKGRAIDVRQVGRELNIRYVLEGSVQRGGNRLRVNVQLIDAETGNHLWAERFEKPVTDLFDMQDEIVSRLSNTLGAQLIEVEARQAERSLLPNSMDLYFQGMAWLNKGGTIEHVAPARGFFERALALDPDNVEALIGMALVGIGSRMVLGRRIAPLEDAQKAVIKVLSMYPQYAKAHLTLGMIHVLSKHPTQGIAECKRALALDPNLAMAHASIGMAKYYSGRGEETEAHINQALGLSPRDTFAYVAMHYAGLAKLQIGADAEAAVWLSRSVETNRNSNSHFALAAALAQIGRLDDARAAVRAGLAVNPSFAIHHRRVATNDNPTYLAGLERIFNGMRMAGVPVD
ncbi:TolB-like protein/class 3 adenylate cyclase/Tfp pilus assembly protein PilF [Bradyrhizobium japonicum]